MDAMRRSSSFTCYAEERAPELDERNVRLGKIIDACAREMGYTPRPEKFGLDGFVAEGSRTMPSDTLTRSETRKTEKM